MKGKDAIAPPQPPPLVLPLPLGAGTMNTRGTKLPAPPFLPLLLLRLVIYSVRENTLFHAHHHHHHHHSFYYIYLFVCFVFGSVPQHYTRQEVVVHDMGGTGLPAITYVALPERVIPGGVRLAPTAEYLQVGDGGTSRRSIAEWNHDHPWLCPPSVLLLLLLLF